MTPRKPNPDVSETFSFVQGDATWEKLRDRCKTDLYWFASTVLGYGKKFPVTPGLHGLMCLFASRRLGIPEIDGKRYRKTEMPRGTGKTSLITVCAVLQQVLIDPNTSILIANERLENAMAFLSSIKAHLMTNQLLRELFPDIIPDDLKATTWATDKIIVTRTAHRPEPTIFCIGTGGTVTGMHPDIICADDILSREAAENARMGQTDMTGRTNRWITQLVPLLSPQAEPFPQIWFQGTKWFAGDSYEFIEEALGYGEAERTWRVTQKLPDGTKQSVNIRTKGDLACFTRSAIEDGKATWPENPAYTLEALAKLRMMDPALFAANYQNQPSDEVTSTFKESWLRFYDWLDPYTFRLHKLEGGNKVVALADCDCVALVDPGGFGRQRGVDRMRGAIVISATVPQSLDHVLLEAFSDQITYQQVIEQLMTYISRYPVRKVFIEVAGTQAAFVQLVRTAMKERGIGAMLDTVSPASQVKEQRILALEPYFQRGQVYIGTGAPWTEFREQYRTFPQRRRVDLLDALAYGPSVWRKVKPTHASPVQRQQQERDAYYTRRGIALTNRPR